MNCPVCAQTLTEIEKRCFVCPNGHGALLPASFLAAQNDTLVQEVDAVDREVPETKNRQYPIDCPSCHQKMSAVDYCSSGIFIDSCLEPTCHARWLDGDELGRIKNRKAKFQPEDLLKLTELEAQTEKMRNRHQPDNNPRLPAITQPLLINHRTSWLGMGLVASRLLRACIDSPFIRVITLIFFIVIAILAYFIFKSLDKL